MLCRQAGGHRHSSTHAAHVLQQLKHEHQRAHKTRSRRSRAPGSKRQQWQAWLAGELDFAGLGLDPDMQLGPAVPHAAQGLQTLPSPAGAHQQMVPPDQSASEPAAPQPEAWETPHPTRHEHQHAPVDVTQQPSPSESWDQSIHIDAEAAAGIEFEVEEEIEYDESSPMSHASLQQTARMAPMPSRTPPAGDTTAPTPTHVDGDHQEYDYEYVYEEVDAQALAEDIKSNTPAGPSRSPPPAPAPSYDTARKVVIKLPSDGQLFTGPQQHPPPTASQGGVKPPPPPPPPPPLKVPPPSQGPPTLVSTPIKGPAPSDTVKRALTDTVTSPPAAPAPTAPPLQAKHSPAPLPPALPVKQPAARNNTFGSPGPRNIGKDNPKPREQPVGYGDYGSYWGYGGAAPREQHPAGSGGHGSAKHSKQPVGYGGVGEYWGKGGYGGMDSKNRKPPAPAPPPKGLLSPPPPKSVADTSPASGSGGQEAPQAGGKQGAGSKQEPGQAPSKEAPVGSWKPPGPRGKEQQGVDDRAKDTPRTPRDSSDDGFDSGISEPAAGVGDGEFEEEGLDPGVLPPSVGDDYDDDAASPPVGGWPTTPPESSDADAGLVPASECVRGSVSLFAAHGSRAKQTEYICKRCCHGQHNSAET